MKKILGICICLVLLAVAIAAPTAFAAESPSSSAVTIHFLNPTAIAYANGQLFVADNIDDNNSAIHCFDVSDTATRIYTQSLTEKVVNLAAKDDESLYVVYANKIVEYGVSDNKLAEKAIITGYSNPVDVTYGADLDGHNEYILTNNALYRKNGAGTANSETITGTKSCIAIGDYVYYLYSGENGVDICKSYNGKDRSTPSGNTTSQGILNSSDPTDSNYYLKDFGAQDLLVWDNDNVALFNEKQISYVNISASCSLLDVFDYHASQAEQENKKNIVDVAVSTNRIYVLNDNFQVDIFEKSENDYVLKGTVGDDTVYQTVPTSYTSFTLVRTKGYPTNLVYKTSDEATTVVDLIKNATEYIIVGFDGDATSNYYYVLVGNKFGWVQKSEGATDPKSDDNLQIIDTSVSNDYVDVTTYFNSLNAVYVHKLPLEESSHTVFTQTPTTKPEVKLLQKFIETKADGDVVWCYVSFVDDGNTVYGFVKEEHIGEFSNKLKDGVPTQEKKINSTLFEAVKLYKDAEMTVVYDTENSPNGIKLYSGQRVKLIYSKDGVACVQILYDDGSQIVGYLQSNKLIAVTTMTSNAIVGLSLLGVVVVLAVTLVIIFVKRKNGSAPKRKKTVKTEE